ncbi:CRISPR-associated helicase/endonuclease Cas3 [Derxia gummosa]|uniref:CRISPR-associated helicase/endonuclease Cas3 n=1 Tax=Derxia gummosa DSM 723 TaxID=1121388 RepID=A0A8B6X9F5_9BURK|nr:CRISPR-associated helicase/endonuclease Cas3 [Derxia gummosa]
MPSYHAYWGKARPTADMAELHLLVHHSLDVAAVGHAYLRRHPALLDWLAARFVAPRDVLLDWFVFWLALHDLGKFSITFQRQRSDLVEQLQGQPAPEAQAEPVRHDSLGFGFWREYMCDCALDEDWFGEFDSRSDLTDAVEPWVRVATGHHGMPPRTDAGVQATRHFTPRGAARDAPSRNAADALDFVAAMRAMFLSPATAALVTRPDFADRSRELSWWLAGVVVLADWIGSDTDHFPYRATALQSLAGYWADALAHADAALDATGILVAPLRAPLGFAQLFPRIPAPSPLQAWAAELPVAPRPQLHLLEDVTGAGKTEAAVMLTQRLIAAGVADGFFIGLPTMATANAMHERISQVYRPLFGEAASLALAHGRRNLVEAFAASVLRPGRADADPDAPDGDDTATARCTAWLADHNKRALLAPAGVGTIDQALLATLRSKHQSLRLLGLFRKVLVVDEVHACDAYMLRTLELLLEFHARAGGSAVLLSATLPMRMKRKLLAAFAQGAGQSAAPAHRRDYPLVTSWVAGNAADEPAPAVPPVATAVAAATLTEQPIATRAAVRRRVGVRHESDRAALHRLILDTLAAGRCVAWIRNTVADVLDAHAELAPALPAGSVTVFHARFALADRLVIEQRVLATFGRDSGPAERRGQLLLASQVAEQSLDIDADLLVTDLAPIDRLVQRAGRLMRHVRDAEGRASTDPQAGDARGEPLMVVFGPAFTEAPRSDWFKDFFPKASGVYPDHGQLWLTARALQAGGFTMPDDARALVEAVYDGEAELPAGLQASSNRAEGKAYGDRSLADANVVDPERGYVRGGSEWDTDESAPSRLGEDTHDVLLCRWDGGVLRPLHAHADPRAAWAYSGVRIARRLLCGVPQPADAARATALAECAQRLPGQGRWSVLLPLESDGKDGFAARALRLSRDEKAELPARCRYSSLTGLVLEDEAAPDPEGAGAGASRQ